MKTLFTIFSALLLFSSCGSSDGAERGRADSSLRAAKPKPSLPPALVKRLHDSVEAQLTSGLLRSNRFNGSILVAKEGTIVYEHYSGYRDPKLKDSIGPETPLQIASTSKTFTSAAVLQLVQSGRLRLNEPVTTFFPQFPYPDVTVQLLLNHRSGLPEYLYYMDQGGWDRKVLASNSDVLQTLISWNPGRSSRPDTRFFYCNTNFVVLALIVEKVSGLSFPDYLQQHIFKPLGMTQTFVHTPASGQVANFSYQPNGAPWPQDFSDGPYGDKNIYSTPRDLLKWDQALYDTAFLSPALLDSAWTGYSYERAGTHNYGLGWRILELPNGKRATYHNGRWHGFNSAFAHLRDEKATIIILTNHYNRSVYTTARKLYNIFGPYSGTEVGAE